jgi:hypothetical protein
MSTNLKNQEMTRTTRVFPEKNDSARRRYELENWLMTERGRTTFVFCLLFALASPLPGQKEPDEVPQISVLGTRTLFIAEVRLYASKVPFFVPYCGTDESGVRFLCTRGTHLEEKTPQGWRKAEVRGAASLGGSSLLSVPGQLIPPRDRGSFRGNFTFIFAPEVFGIAPRTRLRVVVDTWPSKESLASGAPATQVTSSEFVYQGE